MILAAMALAAVESSRFGRAERARDARYPRLVAMLLDTIFVGILTSIATAVYGVTTVTWGSSGSSVPINGSAVWGSAATIPGIWTLAIWIGYYTVCEAMFSATPGKALNGLRVVSVDGRRLTVWSVVVRNLARIIDALPLLYLIGGFAVLSTPKSQRLGDMVGGTTVVLRRHAVEPGAIRTSSRAARQVFVLAVAAAVVFTAVFDYFGRPALVIQGLYNQRLLGNRDIVSYSLGTPTRTLHSVTYPIRARTSTTTCSGKITLYWEGLFGWQMGTGEIDCPPP
jgi:uncharacterized RDD family membrane protein YckC